MENGNTEPVSLGFIGFGTIASAIARGLASTEDEAKSDKSVPSFSKINVSRRSETRSSAIKLEFPDLVSVYDDNQAIIDNSDFVFLCVLNNQTEEALQKLSFDSSRHTLVSLVVRTLILELLYCFFLYFCFVVV